VQAYAAGVDAFSAKLNDNGALQWNTFLSGTGDDYGIGSVVGESGTVFIAGASDSTWGTPVRVYTSGGDVFAAMLNGNGSLQWNTFLGGPGEDYAIGLALDESGDVYLTGGSKATWGSPVRVYTAGEDAFAARLNGSGNLQWNTFIGGTGNDRGNSIALDANTNVYIAGYSYATWGSPVRAFTFGPDAFAAMVSAPSMFLPLVLREE
jgi:hypothetical protein